MREIKFRGKSIHTFSKGEWVYGYLVELVEKERLFIGQWKAIGGDATIKDELFQSYIPVDPETVGQYTGLKDKHGREIYTGQKLRITMYDHWSGQEIAQQESVVEFRDCKFGITWSRQFSGMDSFSHNVTFEVVDEEGKS